MMSLMEKEIAVGLGDLIQDHENWVQMWIDTGHIVLYDTSNIQDFRGIDFDWQLTWLTRHPKKRYGYHSLASDPFDAINEAKQAWAQRALVKAKWPEVKALAWDVALGRKSLQVTREDAYRSPLCPAGIDSFMKRIGLPKRQTIDGRTAACLMLFDNQLGFVINSAAERVFVYNESAKVSADGGYLVERRT